MRIVLNNKRAIREKFKALRMNLTSEEVLTKSAQIKNLLFKLQEFKNAQTVAFYIAKKSSREVETEDMIKESTKMGKRVIVPIVEAGRKLAFSELRDFDSELAPGAFGILEPKPSSRRLVPVHKSDIIIVPGVAFDLRGNRLGQGGGYYDRLLGELASIKPSPPFVGLAYEMQVVEKLPNVAHDVPINILVTELRALRFKR